MHNNYFEGILQLRNENKKLKAAVRKLVDDAPKVFISKEVRSGDGTDFYLSSRKFLHKIGKELKRRYTGELKESAQLFTRNHQTSKNVYRVNILFRYCPVKKGQKLNYRGEDYQITSIDNKVHAKNISSGKKKTFSYSEISEALRLR